jgi:cell division protein FtsN
MPTKEKVNLILVLCGILVLLLIGISKESFPYKFVEKEIPEDYTNESVEIKEPELKTPMYYLVVGSFSEQLNAEEFSNRMYDLGLNPYILPITDGHYRVGIFSSPYREDVVTYKKELEQTIGKMWITYQ